MLLAVLFFIPISFANSLSEKEVKTLEFSRVKLGMTEPQLVQLLKSKYPLTDTDFIIKDNKLSYLHQNLGNNL